MLSVAKRLITSQEIGTFHQDVVKVQEAAAALVRHIRLIQFRNAGSLSDPDSSTARPVSVFIRSQRLRTSPIDFRRCLLQLNILKIADQFLQHRSPSGQNNWRPFATIGSVLADLGQCDCMECANRPQVADTHLIKP